MITIDSSFMKRLNVTRIQKCLLILLCVAAFAECCRYLRCWKPKTLVMVAVSLALTLVSYNCLIEPEVTRSSNSMNEPERIFCYVSIISMNCLDTRQVPDMCLSTFYYD